MAKGLLLGIAAGVGFGLFYVALDASPPESGLWPLLATKLASIAVYGPLVLACRTPGNAAGVRADLIVLSGATDMVSNILFLLATRDGALGVSAVLASLYPVVVVVLALTAGALLSGR